MPNPQTPIPQGGDVANGVELFVHDGVTYMANVVTKRRKELIRIRRMRHFGRDIHLIDAPCEELAQMCESARMAKLVEIEIGEQLLPFVVLRRIVATYCNGK